MTPTFKKKLISAVWLCSLTIVDKAEINFGCAASYGRAALRPRRQVAFLVTPGILAISHPVTSLFQKYVW